MDLSLPHLRLTAGHQGAGQGREERRWDCNADLGLSDQHQIHIYTKTMSRDISDLLTDSYDSHCQHQHHLYSTLHVAHLEDHEGAADFLDFVLKDFDLH